jgi:hypothetical protein
MNKFLTSRIVVLVCLALVSLQSFAGTISGQVQNAQSGPVANATFSFTLTAPATIAGTATVVTSSVSCYTDANGNVVGEPNPLVSPVVNANIASGTLAAGTYYTRIAYLDATGTSFAGPETATVLSSIGSLIVTAPVKQPLSATGYKVFISSASGTETLQGTVTGTPGTWANFTQSASLAAGAALPVSNTTVCTIRFNDELTPSFTCYDVGLVGSTGANISGFPQFISVPSSSGHTFQLWRVNNPYPVRTRFQSPLHRGTRFNTSGEMECRQSFRISVPSSSGHTFQRPFEGALPFAGSHFSPLFIGAHVSTSCCFFLCRLPWLFQSPLHRGTRFNAQA